MANRYEIMVRRDDLFTGQPILTTQATYWDYQHPWVKFYEQAEIVLAIPADEIIYIQKKGQEA